MLVFLIFSSCVEKDSNLNNHTVKVEFIENTYLALKPSNITSNSYKNPRNIFLEIESINNSKTRMSANWYKKTNGVYQLFCLNDTGRKLDQNLAYEIIDTLNLSEDIIKYRNKNVDSIDKAYQGKTILIKRIIKRESLEEYFWTKMTVMSKDSILKYNSETKSFFTTTTRPETKLQADFGPIIIVLILFLLALSIVLREKIKWLKRLREHIFENNFFDILNNNHQLNSWLLFFIITLFNFIYALCLTGQNPFIWLLIGISMGLISKGIFWLSKIKINLFKTYNLNVPLSISAISVIGLIQSAVLNGMPEKFCYISLIIILLPALLDVILFVVEQNKLKNF
jgi:hypothetical protein